MARPRNQIFYENPLTENYLQEHTWLRDYYDNSCKVVDYLVGNGVKETIYYSTIRCLDRLKDSLLSAEQDYSEASALEWFEKSGPHPKGYLTALFRLADIYYYGAVQPENAFPVSYPNYSNLHGIWKSELDAFTDSLDFSTTYIKQIRVTISRFLYRIQEAGIECPSGLNYAVLESYLANGGHRSAKSCALYTYVIGDILSFMASRGLCSQGLGWYPYYRMHGRILRENELSESEKKKIMNIHDESGITTKRLSDMIADFTIIFESFGYKETSMNEEHLTLHNLLLFLDMHGYQYHYEIAMVWLEHQKMIRGKGGWKSLRRILNLFDTYIKEEKVLPQTVYRNRKLICDWLPVWCKKELDAFLDQKKKEGWEESTLCMYRSSATRFCQFLADNGLVSFTGITPDIIVEFNRSDPHLTSKGKNAYNIRIRTFIKYMERRDIIPYGMHRALFCTSAPKENIVITLTDNEKKTIAKKHEIASTQVELRNRAIMLIGMRMGLRASDIVKIRLYDINWNCQTIRILQKKTLHEIELPMPTDVGNSIYLYIKNGRPDTGSTYLFVKSKIPYDAVSRNACRYALISTLPDRHKPYSGFHVTRKTFATDQINKNIAKNIIADMLGHRDASTLSHYLNLDSEHMRMCPLSLGETDLTMKGGRYD